MSAGREEMQHVFLRRIADFLEAHGRDEGGYSSQTRADFAVDAARLRRMADKHSHPDSMYHTGDRVVVTIPDKAPRPGTVASNSMRADLVNVRLDGLKSVDRVHVTFVERAP